MPKHDYRTKALKGYVYSPDTQSGDSEICPKCNQWFSTSSIETCDMFDGSYDYGICPHCGALLKLQIVPSYYFDAEICSPEEFEEETGEDLSEENLPADDYIDNQTLALAT